MHSTEREMKISAGAHQIAMRALRSGNLERHAEFWRIHREAEARVLGGVTSAAQAAGQLVAFHDVGADHAHMADGSCVEGGLPL